MAEVRPNSTIVTSGADGPEIWLVELQGHLAQNGSATGFLQKWNGTTYVKTQPTISVTVYDYCGYCAEAFAKVHAVYHRDSKRFVALSPKIGFTLVSVSGVCTNTTFDSGAAAFVFGTPLGEGEDICSDSPFTVVSTTTGGVYLTEGNYSYGFNLVFTAAPETATGNTVDLRLTSPGGTVTSVITVPIKYNFTGQIVSYTGVFRNYIDGSLLSAGVNLNNLNGANPYIVHVDATCSNIWIKQESYGT